MEAGKVGAAAVCDGEMTPGDNAFQIGTSVHDVYTAI